MKTRTARGVMPIHGFFSLYASTLLSSLWCLIKRKPKSKIERALDGLARYSKLRDLAKFYRLQAAEFEIQAEQIRLELRSEKRALRRTREEEFYKRLGLERRQ